MLLTSSRGYFIGIPPMRPLPPDHDEFVAWHTQNRLKVWGVFNRFLHESIYEIRPVGMEQPADWAPTRIRREFSRWLAKKFPNEPKLRNWTNRGMHHELKPRKFYRKDTTK